MNVPNYPLNVEDASISFQCKTMEGLYDAFKGEADHAHRHNYYSIIWVIDGKGQHIIDMNSYELASSQIFFIHPNQVHQLIASERPKGFIISFSKDFLINNSIRECFISDINVFKDYGDASPLVIDEETSGQLYHIIKQINVFNESDMAFKYEGIGSLLKLFLIHCNNSCNRDEIANPQLHNAGITILRNFKSLVNEQYKTQHKVKYYAEEMHITNDHLNKTIKTLIGKSAKEYIQSRIIIEAKRLLLFSDITAKEIAFSLGFDDPSHFSAFFKKCTNTSISSFRK